MVVILIGHVLVLDGMTFSEQAQFYDCRCRIVVPLVPPLSSHNTHFYIFLPRFFISIDSKCIPNQVVFLLGHDLLAGTIWCKVVAIALHYFYLCAFAWMFIEGIHLYRMMTDKPGIDHGQMHFYYAVGYGLPAIIVGLAVGLRPDAYGQDFCWLSIGEKIIWSFAGPICIVVCLNFVVFIVAFRYSCRHPKVRILMIGMNWVFICVLASL